MYQCHVSLQKQIHFKKCAFLITLHPKPSLNFHVAEQKADGASAASSMGIVAAEGFLEVKGPSPSYPEQNPSSLCGHTQNHASSIAGTDLGCSMSVFQAWGKDMMEAFSAVSWT